jgi:peroxiredoxin Q/BCP
MEGVAMKIATLLVAIVFYSLTFGEDQMLKINDTAPGFSLTDQNGLTYNLGDFKEKKFVVLIFYPGDQTPVCTQQLCEVRDDYSEFASNDAVVFGVNPASDKSHKKFAEKNNLPFPLLIDSKKEVALKYHAKGLVMNQRTVYVIGKDGKVIFAKRGKPAVSEIIGSIKNVNGNGLKIDLNK